MHELPKDLTNSLRSFRGSIYGRGQTRQGDEEARLENVDLEKGSEGYKDKEFDRALDTSQSSFDKVFNTYRCRYNFTELNCVTQQSATSAQNMDHIQSEPRKDDGDVEKQAQALRFEDEEEQEEHDAGHGAERPRVDTSMDAARKAHHHTPNTPGKQSILQGAHVKDLDPAADRLAENLTPLTKADFYQLMGLNQPTPEKEDIEQLIKPHGLYAKMVKGASYTNKKYRTVRTPMGNRVTQTTWLPRGVVL